jgi:UDP-N-acetylglucosamine 1-carboxyvinyltransferase
MSTSCLRIQQSPALSGQMMLDGAKNAILVIMASTLLTHGITTLKNVPASDDVYHMAKLLMSLGARVTFYPETNTMHVDTRYVNAYAISVKFALRYWLWVPC